VHFSLQAVQAGIIIFSLSAGTIYLLRASELLVQLCNAFDFALSADEAHILFGIICFVLSSAKQVYSIRTISMCSVLSVFYLVGLSIVHCSLRLTTQEVAFDDHLRRENVNLFYGSMTGILKAFPMMIFAFAAQVLGFATRRFALPYPALLYPALHCPAQTSHLISGEN